MQSILYASENYAELDLYFAEKKVKKILLVCDNSIRFLRLNEYFESLENRSGIKVVRFSDFEPNPNYESVVRGVELFHKESCEMIAVVGGGSAIDVAKCIKLYSNMDSSENYLKQEIVPNDIVLFAVPTTAGTGSEATRYAVIYYNGEKQSVTSDSCIPGTVLFDASVLKTLPIYQKKATMMDAFCHAIESFWSVNSTDESKQYSKEAIQLILANMDDYLSNDENANAKMLKAANIAGKAINITQTTAGHAMCYKLTSLYGIAHGHAAALCDKVLFPYMIANTDKCIDKRGEQYLKESFNEIAAAMGCPTAEKADEKLAHIVDSLELESPKAKDANDIDVLKTSVNPDRLKNNPVKLSDDVIEKLYLTIIT
ncbi:phosphonoacetaldehyde reductase [Ruminococcus sp. FC2018]|uniref:phosphonoacetaldehyde reductase n=1 Tax=Ruminococcus sp. FC2018 TaxID=1410617 RepID=UPI000563572D|nr:phosphonoacetaldehyde reductase [Ruminococcus sp. FC2018]